MVRKVPNVCFNWTNGSSDTMLQFVRVFFETDVRYKSAFPNYSSKWLLKRTDAEKEPRPFCSVVRVVSSYKNQKRGKVFQQYEKNPIRSTSCECFMVP